jgi:hypothetical protein
MTTNEKTALVLRTCAADMTSYSGFQWPAAGSVEAPDWNPSPVCGGGLHGLLWGEGDGALLNWRPDAVWLVVEVEVADIVALGTKVKFPRGTVVYAGGRAGAIDYLTARAPRGVAIVGAAVTTGDHGTATAGYRGTATAGGYGTATAGYRGTATVGDCGTAIVGDGGTATAGYHGHATAEVGGHATAGEGGTAAAGEGGTATAGVYGTATAGDYGTATAGDYGTATAGTGGTATAGYRGTAMVGPGGTATAGICGTAAAGEGGTAAAGEGGILSLRWWDGTRYRVTTLYVGEDGIQAGQPYRVDARGRAVRVERD